MIGDLRLRSCKEGLTIDGDLRDNDGGILTGVMQSNDDFISSTRFVSLSFFTCKAVDRAAVVLVNCAPRCIVASDEFRASAVRTDDDGGDAGMDDAARADRMECAFGDAASLVSVGSHLGFSIDGQHRGRWFDRMIYLPGPGVMRKSSSSSRDNLGDAIGMWDGISIDGNKRADTGIESLLAEDDAASNLDGDDVICNATSAVTNGESVDIVAIDPAGSSVSDGFGDGDGDDDVTMFASDLDGINATVLNSDDNDDDDGETSRWDSDTAGVDGAGADADAIDIAKGRLFDGDGVSQVADGSTHVCDAIR